MKKLLFLIIAIALCVPKSHAQKKVKAPVVVLTFDDAEASHYTVVAPLLKKFKMDATFFVCDFPWKNPADSVKYSMSWAQISHLNKMGFEIGSHTGHHKNVTKLNREQIEIELSYIEARCRAHGIPDPVSFAFPGNRSDSLSVAVLRERGYQFARVGGSKLYDPSADDRLTIPSYTLASAGRIKDRVTKALEGLQKGQILVLTIHGVPDIVHPDYSTTAEDLTGYLQYIKKHKYKVIAMRDLHKYLRN